jgi:transcriptional regulator with XRE-family HTH domain
VVRASIEQHIGARIKARRDDRGLSQESIGVVLGVTYQQVQKFETGRNRIAASQLHLVAGALDVGMDFFFEGFTAPVLRRSGRGRRVAR